MGTTTKTKQSQSRRVQCSVSLYLDTVTAIEAQAELQSVSRSAIIETALTQWLSRQKKVA